MGDTKSSERVPAAVAVAELETTHLRLLTLIKEGNLEGVQEGGEWFVSRESLDCLKAHGGVASVQRACRTSCGGNCAGHGK